MNNSPLAKSINKFSEGQIKFDTKIEGLSLHHSKTPTSPTSYLFSPHLCLIAQGSKQILLGNESYIYDQHSYLISSVDLPIVTQIIEASANEPYLGLTLELDLNAISQIITEGNFSNTLNPQEHRGMGVSRLSEPLLNAVQRLLDLLETPNDISVLAPIIKREIYYRLLLSDQGYRLRQIISIGTQKNKISKAINWLKDNFDKQFRIKDLADSIGMSESTFHQHFRSLTAMSPLQYQKRIRLNEAKRLMLIEKLDASNASFLVGYESPTQFNREYKRMFGNPPSRDTKQKLS